MTQQAKRSSVFVSQLKFASLRRHQVQQKVVLTFEDGETYDKELRSFLSPADQVAFERTYNVGMGSFEDTQKAEWVLYFIWRAYRREAKDTRSFDEWLDKLANYEVPAGDADPPAGSDPQPE